MKKICLYCGKEFNAWEQRAKYCSRTCLFLFRRKQTSDKRKPVIEGSITRIPLTLGLFAIIDTEDLPKISDHNWFSRKGRRTFYAISHTYGGKDSTIQMHRIICGVNNPKIQVDHKDHNGLNNRKENLRICTHSQNLMNRGSESNSTSKYKGVHWGSFNKKWCAKIAVNRKTYHVGYFDDEMEAALAYDAKAKELHKEFAKLNFPERG